MKSIKSPRRHQAEQLVSAIVDPPVKLSLTLLLKGDVGRTWRRYADAHRTLNPSNGQLAESLIRLGLERWQEVR